MRTRLAIIAVVLAPLSARADLHLGAQVNVMPVGTIEAGAISTDAAVAFGLQGFIDYGLTRNFYIGAAPQLILNVKSKDSDSSAQELDLFGRVMLRLPVAPGIQLFGYLAPGYSVIFVPDKPPGVSNPTGFVLGFAGGISYSFTRELFLAGELGYQIGFQSTDGNDFRSRYLHIGLALGVMIY